MKTTRWIERSTFHLARQHTHIFISSYSLKNSYILETDNSPILNNNLIINLLLLYEAFLDICPIFAVPFDSAERWNFSFLHFPVSLGSTPYSHYLYDVALYILIVDKTSNAPSKKSQVLEC